MLEATFGGTEVETDCLTVFDHFVGLALKGLNHSRLILTFYTLKSILKPLVSENIKENVTQLTFVCSKSTIETLEKSVKYVYS